MLSAVRIDTNCFHVMITKSLVQGKVSTHIYHNEVPITAFCSKHMDFNVKFVFNFLYITLKENIRIIF